MKDMDQAYELLEQGRVGMTTIMGMGGVFLALLCLYGFTTALRTLLSRNPSKPKEKPAATRASTAPADSKEAGSAGNEKLAAAMAVAIAIQADSQRVLPLAVAADGPLGVSPWKIVGRRALMSLPVKSPSANR
jgi:sodium pump decarboxylase gamma subunit